MISNLHRAPAEQASSFPKHQGLAYAAPTVGFMLFFSSLGLLPVIYAKYFGLALTTIATVMLVARLFDAVTDPLIAHYSDLYRRKHGTRKPFVLVGGLGCMASAYFLCVPLGEITITYFVFWYFVYYLFQIIYRIPMSAWAIEVTNDPEGRTFIFSVLVFLIKIGELLFFLVPFLPFFSSTDYTPETIKVVVMLGVVLMLPALLIALKYVPNGPQLTNNPNTNTHEKNQEHCKEQGSIKTESFKQSLLDFYATAKHNKPFHNYLVAAFFSSIGAGMFGGLFFLYVDAFLGMGDKFASVGILGTLFSMLIIPVCYKLAVRWGKKTVWLISGSALLCGIFFSGLVSPETATFGSLLIINGALMLSSGFGAVSMPAIYADILDYGSLLDATDRKAMYVSITGFLVKAEVALAASLGFWIAGWFGFDATATEHTEQSTFAIRLAMSWVPLVITSFMLFFIWKMPLNDRRTAIIRRRLNARTSRAMAAA
jgi:GPH family glycoside/pentoside/hexuronide:cation symporter